MNGLIKIENVEQCYQEGVPVLKNLNLTIEKGEFVVLIGPSGCGKTTLLKMINGLIIPQKGMVSVEGKALNDWDLIELRRNIGYVVQQVGLFPHYTVEKNIEYVLDLEGVEKSKKSEISEQLIETVGLNRDFLKRYPRSLSGGQQQRVSLARALARDPEIVLMDEPFSAVDEITRRNLQEEIKDLHSRMGKTIVFVTHDIEEAFRLGTKIVFLKDGKIHYAGTPKDFLNHEGDAFFKAFFGLKTFSLFLSTTMVKDVMDEKFSLKPAYKISAQASVLEGLKMFMEYSCEHLIVIDDKGNEIGSFKCKNLMHILKGRELNE